MPSITLRNDRWPVGASVSAYARSPVTGLATGAALETHAVAADGTLTFTTLSEGQQYVATDGTRSATFLVSTPASSGGGGGISLGTVATGQAGDDGAADATGGLLNLTFGAKVSPAWQSLVPYLVNGWRDYTVTTPGDEPFFYGPEYAKIGNLVLWRGVIDGGAASAGTAFSGLPAGITPARIATFIVSTASGLKDWNLWPDGHFAPVSGGALAYSRIDGAYLLGAGT